MTPRLAWNNPLIVSTAALLLVAGYLLSAATGVVGAAFTGGSRSTSATNAVATLITQHDEDQETYLKRYDGRSLFFIPRKTYVPPIRTVSAPPPRDRHSPTILPPSPPANPLPPHNTAARPPSPSSATPFGSAKAARRNR